MSDIPQQLQLAAKRLQAGDGPGCQMICNELLSNDPRLLAAYNLRGLAAAQGGEPAAAIRDLSRVWPAQPLNTQAALWLGRMYRIQGEYSQAIAPLQAAAAETMLEAGARYELARVLTRLRRSNEARQQYERILALQPAHVDAAANLAFLLERANRLAEAEALADRALQADPKHFMAQLTKATLERRKGLLHEARARLETQLQHPHTTMNESILLNQQGQCLLDQREYPQAFERFTQSNTLLRERHPLGRATAQGSYGLDTIAELQDWLEQNPPSQWSESPLDTDPRTPVFLVGFPRSGTTLLDQALSAHPDIEVLEEYEFFDEVRRDWVEGSGLQSLADMSPPDQLAARQQYRQALQARRTTSKACVVDKLPLNLLYLFLIHRLFPDARILFMLRDPRDACLSCYFQSFDLQGAMPYFLNLQDTGHYYHAAMSLAKSSLDVIDNPVHLQRYEQLVSHFEPAMRSMLDFLELPWSHEVLQYRQKSESRVIDTPSYQQVTRPLYADSIGRWRHFSSQMEPLKASLGPWVEHFDYPAN